MIEKSREGYFVEKVGEMRKSRSGKGEEKAEKGIRWSGEV